MYGSRASSEEVGQVRSTRQIVMYYTQRAGQGCVCMGWDRMGWDVLYVR